MTVSKYLKALLDRAAEISSQLKRIESAENRDAMQLRHGIGSVYPAMFGELSAVIGIAGRDITLALQQIEHVERLERIEAAFDSLDIELNDENLRALELIATERRYRHLSVSIAIQNAISSVQDEERERESDNAAASLVSAGFVHADDEDYWDRDDMRVTIESKIRNGATFYAWELASNLSGEQVTIDSGTSGGFSRLLSAISPVAQEVKERKTSGCESPQGPPKTLNPEVPMVAD